MGDRSVRYPAELRQRAGDDTDLVPIISFTVPAVSSPSPRWVERIDRALDSSGDLITLANGTDLDQVCGAWCQTRMRLAPTSQLRLEAGQGGCSGP